MSDSLPVIPGVVFRLLHVLGHGECAVGENGTVMVRGRGGVWRVANPTYRSSGRPPYPFVSLWFKDEGRSRQFNVHKLVLLAFVGPRPAGMQACHNDGNPLNFHLTNLRWDTVRANHADKRKHGTQTFGESHSRAKLTATQVTEIRGLAASGMQHKAIARRFGIGPSQVARIVRREQWAHIPNPQPR